MAKVQLRFCGSDVTDRRDYCFRWGCIGNWELRTDWPCLTPCSLAARWPTKCLVN